MEFSLADFTSCSVGSYRIELGRRLRIEEYHGTVTLDDLKEIARAVAADPDWSPKHHGLIDFSEAELELTANDVLRLGLMLRQERHRSHGWLAFVVSNSVAYGVVRMLGHWSRSNERMRIFQSRKEAERWLQHNRDKAPPTFRESFVASLEPALLAAV